MAIKPNPFVENLAPYVTTSQEPWVVKDRSALHKMDWNEGPRPPKSLKELAAKLITKDEIFSWYPDCNTYDLTATLADFLLVSEMNILTFPGSDVALETLCRTYLSAGDKVVVLTPTYEHVFVYIACMGAEVLPLPLQKPFQFELAAVVEFLHTTKAKALYLVRPNNPCGYMIDAADIVQLCQQFPELLVIADEAYIEFADQPSLVNTVLQLPNLVVLRTFSKAFALAGVRIGYMVAHHQVLQYVSRLRNGKNIAMLGQLLAIEALKQRELLQQHLVEVRAARQWLCARFADHGITYFSSQGNFVLFELDNPRQIVAELKVQGVYVRDRSGAIARCVRVTITDQASTEFFWKCLQRLLT